MIKTAVLITTLWFTLSFAEKDVTIVAVYQLNSGRTGPPYDVDITMTGLDDEATLLDAMEKAQNEGYWTFSGIEYDPPLGFYVTTINGIEADSAAQQYWHILGGKNMEPLQLGVSNYVPANGETDLFRLDTWTEGDKETESGHAEPGHDEM